MRSGKLFTTKIRDFAGETPLQAMAKQGGYQPTAMTPQERSKPELIKASRKRRIAAGAGVPVQAVNQLLNQFEQMQKMMKMMKGGNLQRMMRNMKGMLPGMR